MKKQIIKLYTPNQNYQTTINISNSKFSKKDKEKIFNEIKSKQFIEISDNGEKMYIETKNILDIDFVDDENTDENKIGF